jgi:uncharacterized protein (UPF0303 family)
VNGYGDRLQELAREEDEIQFASFDNDLALEIGLRLTALAREEGKPIVVDLTRGGQQLFHYALPGTAPDNDAWVQRKRRVVERFGHSSFHMGIRCASAGTTLSEKYLLDPHEYAAHGGSFPIIVRGVGPVGTATVSGLPQEEDHALVVRVLREFAARAA